MIVTCYLVDFLWCHLLDWICFYLVLTFFSNLQEAVQPKGIRDDTTCIVIDIQLPEKANPPPPPPPKRSGKGVFKSMFRKRTSESSSNIQKDFCEPDVVEELYEEGSASLSDRCCLMLTAKCVFAYNVVPMHLSQNGNSHFRYCDVSSLVFIFAFFL